MTKSDPAPGQPNAHATAGIGSLQWPAQVVDLHEIEAEFVRQALGRTDNNQTKATKLLHSSRDQLRERLEKLGLLEPVTKVRQRGLGVFPQPRAQIRTIGGSKSTAESLVPS